MQILSEDCKLQSEKGSSVDNAEGSGKSRRVSIPELPVSSSPPGSQSTGPPPGRAGPQPGSSDSQPDRAGPLPTSRQSSTQTEGLEETRPRRQVRIMELPFRDSQPKSLRQDVLSAILQSEKGGSQVWKYVPCTVWAE